MAEKALSVEGLRKTYADGDDRVVAVDDVSFSIDRGQTVGLLGPNGAGKTTIIKSILGTVAPDRGDIEAMGVDARANPSRVYRRVGAMLEGARNVYWRLTVRENLRFFARLGGEDGPAVRDRHDRLLQRFDLADRADTTVNELSRGMKQKVALASTLARDVDLVFLDEPTLGLDVETGLELRAELTRLADEEDVTVVLTSHDMDTVQAVCEEVVILNDGRVVTHDPVADLLDTFRTRQYRISVSEPVTTDPSALADAASHEWDDDRETLTLTVSHDWHVHDVLRDLRETGVGLDAVETVEPDLQEVFLSVTDSEPTDADAVVETAARGES